MCSCSCSFFFFFFSNFFDPFFFSIIRSYFRLAERVPHPTNPGDAHTPLRTIKRPPRLSPSPLVLGASRLPFTFFSSDVRRGGRCCVFDGVYNRGVIVYSCVLRSYPLCRVLRFSETETILIHFQQSPPSNRVTACHVIRDPGPQTPCLA